jgi:hypothetical protein
MLPATLRITGKRAGGRWLRQLNAVGAFIFIKEDSGDRTFLLDTGTAVRVPFCGSPANTTGHLTSLDNKGILA